MKATYVYCVIAASRPPRLSRVPPGLPGLGPVRLLSVEEGLFAAVADAPLERYGEAAIRRCLGDLDQVSRAAVAHDTLVASFASETAVLPMKLFTLFASDARALVRACPAWRDRHPRQARGAPPGVGRAGGAPPSCRGRAERRIFGGTLGRRLSRLRKARRDALLEPGTPALLEPSAHARGRTLDTLCERLAARAGLAKRRPTDEPRIAGARLLLDAAFLVPRAQAASFEALASRESRRFARHGYRVMLSGPWPPYSFMQD